MPLPLTLRRTRSSDLRRIRQIQVQCYADLPPDRYGALRSRWRADGAACAVAMLQSQVIGHVQAIAWPLGHLLCLDQWIDTPLPAGRDALYIYEVAIAPQHQSLGAGKHLMAHMEAVARARGLKALTLVAYGAALSYWQRQGYEPHPLRDAAAQAALASYGDKGAYLIKRL